ncbi:hypothetical protein MT344_01435 [Clavibacter michiganensis subsp. phaseoli]|uniref:hypothetical protein n=1 Tax=Clavibacter phaseoli TaxID=1734031 RepID=UPI001FB23A45|nr:hypothetical protein [Clavibacter phaseoli]MCJ1709843.1 hypothetical protein [Clavibacter phaseoli]
MDPVEQAELAELRRRAFGPGRDADPTDLDRLRALEERAGGIQPARSDDRGRAIPSARRAAPGEADVDAAGRSAVRAGAEADEDATEDATAGPATARRRRRAILWAASIVVPVALTAVLVTALAAPPGRQVAVLALDPDQPLRDYFGGAETGSARFHGLTLVRLHNDRSAYPQVEGECLTIEPSRAALASTVGGGCAAGAFGASAQFVVNHGAPEELRDVYPVGTALLFDLRGDAVHVRVDDSGRLPSPTRPPT